MSTLESQPLLSSPQRHSTGYAIARIILGILFLQLWALASTAFNGFLFTTAGHAILRSTPLDGYDLPLRGTMQLGALGGVILLPALTTINIFSNCIFPSQQTEHAAPCTTFMKSIFELGKTTAFGAAAGAIGSALLGPRGYTILDLDHAARAGALGGAVIGPGMAIGLILIMMIIQWARPSREN